MSNNRIFTINISYDTDMDLGNIFFPNNTKTVIIFGGESTPLANDQWQYISRIDQIYKNLLSIKFPDFIEEIIFDDDFNYKVDEIIWPSNLKCVEFGSYFLFNIDNVKWPESLRTIKFNTLMHPLLNLPPWLENLEYVKEGNLTKYKINTEDDCIYEEQNKILEKSKIPSGCKITEIIDIDYRTNIDLKNIVFLEYIKSVKIIGGTSDPRAKEEWQYHDRREQIYNNLLSIKFPDFIEEIIFDDDFDYKVDEIVWPSNLKRVEFNFYFSHNIDNVKWPKSLKTIKLYQIRYPLLNLPPCLENLEYVVINIIQNLKCDEEGNLQIDEQGDYILEETNLTKSNIFEKSKIPFGCKITQMAV